MTLFKTTTNLQIVMAVVLLFVSASLMAETGKAPDPNSVVKGKILYQKYCQNCHQQKGVGENPVPWSFRAPGYVPAMPLNDTSHAWHHGDEQLVKMILDGKQGNNRMPSWKGILSEQQAFDVVSYIKSLWSSRSLNCQGPKHMSCMH